MRVHPVLNQTESQWMGGSSMDNAVDNSSTMLKENLDLTLPLD